MTLIHALGWTLLHSIWENALVAGVLFCLNILMRKAGANARYCVAVLALAVCVLLPAATCWSLLKTDQPTTTAPITTAIATTQQTKPTLSTPEAWLNQIPQPPTTLETRLEPYLPNLVVLWLTGIFVMTVRLLGGFLTVERLRKNSIEPETDAWTKTARALAARMRISRPILLRLCPDVDSPSVVGVFKSLILVPSAFALKLSPDQIEAVLAHELAHVKRYDFVVNLVQSAVESLLFYHPAMWWISSRVRAERENSCDDLALEVVGDKASYAGALLALEEFRLSPRLAMGATSGSLIQRIRRIVTGPQDRPARGAISLAAVLAVVVSVGLVATIRAKQPAQELVTGTVLTPLGQPAQNAHVVIEQFQRGQHLPDAPDLLTDSNGHFSYRSRPGIMAWAFAVKQGVGMAIGPVDVKDGSTKIHLQEVAPLTVRLEDSNHKPLKGVAIEPRNLTLHAYGMATPTSLESTLRRASDSQGLVKLDFVPAGCQIAFQAVDPHTAITDGMPLAINSGRPLTETLHLVPGGSIDGVLDFNGEPVKGALISPLQANFFWNTVNTDERGHFHFDRLAPGDYSISAGLHRNQSPNSSGWIAKPFNTHLNAGDDKSVTIHAEAGALISGAVVDREGKPLSTGTVALTHPNLDPRSGFLYVQISKDGTFKVRVLPGTYQAGLETEFRVSDPARNANPPFTVADGEQKPLVVHAMNQATLLHLSAVDELGHTVSDVRFEVHSISPTNPILGSPMSFRSKTATLEVSTDDLSTCWVTASSHNLYSQGKTALNATGTTVVRLHPVSLSGVRGTVVDAQGAPLANAKVTLGFNEMGVPIGDLDRLGNWSISTDRDGRFSFYGIYSGAHPVIMVSHAGFQDTQSARLMLHPGESTTLATVKLNPAGFIAGTIVDINGNPVTGARVSASGFRVNEFSVRTGADGRFRIERVPLGKIRLYASKGQKLVGFDAKANTDKPYTFK